jgi:hypothetical protein
MQFKHPELLYALFLLLIPIFIHLFQLRRFQKVAFTNVAFLKKVTLQTRKSSQLKKWLTLFIRLLALTFIILAFAQPFSASKTALNTDKETVLYIDNSFSMQAKGNEGPLLHRALQQLYIQKTETDKISWFTNDYAKKNVSNQDFKNDILSVSYSQNQLSPNDILLKANQLFSNKKNTQKRLIIISDFQAKGLFPIPDSNSEDIIIDAVQLKANQLSNINIDTAYIQKKNVSNTELSIGVTAQGEVPETVPISLFNNNILIAKTAIDFSEYKEVSVTFNIDETSGFNGKLELYEPNLLFDNTLFFNLNPVHKIKILSLNGSSSGYLQRVFNPSEFEYSQQDSENLNYSEFPKQNLIILNELKEIPESLTTAIKSFSDNGGSIFVIPSIEADLESYNSFLSKLQIGSFSEINMQEKKITQIVFDHPLYADVFEKQVLNFQYPSINSYYNINSQTVSSILKYEDGNPFIIQKQNTFVATAAINIDNSNFQSSSLIVPTLYNMAKQSLSLPKLYYEIGKKNTYAIPVHLERDEIVMLKDSTVSFIPLQQTKESQVNITTTNEPSKAGIYSIEKKLENIEYVSYNYNREESRLRYANPNDWEGATVHNTVDELFDTITNENTIDSYWKWFTIFAILFLILEMIVLKHYRK